MNLYYEDLFRTETDQDQIDTLLRKGWIECPPEPSYDPQTQAPPYWDTINHAWIVKYLTPEQIAELRNSEYPPVTPRQMRIWLQRQNITSADVELQITNMISNPEAREEAMIEWLDENSAWELEENGWYQSECEMIMDCEPEITLVSETDE